MTQEQQIQTETKVENGTPTAHFEGHPTLSLAGMSTIFDTPHAWSPPHLFLAAVESCVYLTMKAAAEKMRIEIAEYSSKATGTLGSPDGKHTEFTGISVEIRMRMGSPEQEHRIEQLLKIAEEHCYVGRSVKAQITLTRVS